MELLGINNKGVNNGLEETSAISVCYKKRGTNSFAFEYRGRMQRPEIKTDTVASVRKRSALTICGLSDWIRRSKKPSQVDPL